MINDPIIENKKLRLRRVRPSDAESLVPMIAKFGFDNLNLHRIEIVVAVDNLPSQRVAEKAGALREGLLRQRLFVHGQVLDAIMFSFVPIDFIEFQENFGDFGS